MASSIRKGQSLVYCQLCENESKIRWKCLDCKLLMCQKCREKIHPKFKNAQDHKIVDIKEIGLHTQEVKDEFSFSNIKCKQHRGKDCCLLCKSCDQLVCLTCVTSEHKTHELTEIDQAAKTNYDLLKKIEKNLENDLQECDEIKIRNEQLKEAERIKYKRAKEDIFAKKTELKKEVDALAENLDRELDNKWTEFCRNLDGEGGKVCKLQTRIRETLKGVKSTVEGLDALKLIVEGDKILETEATEIPLDPLIKSLPQFVPSNDNIKRGNFGSLQNELDTTVQNLKIKIKNVVITDVSQMHWLSSCSDGIWIGQNSGDNGKIEKIKLLDKGGKCKVLQTQEIDVLDIANKLDSNGNLLISIDDEVLKQINNKSGKMSDSIYDVSPLVTRGVHITRNNQVVISAKNKGTPFPVSGRRAVCVLDEHGTKVAEYEFDKNNKHLFSYPSITSSTNNGHLFIQDILATDGRGRIVVLGNEGNVIAIYTGHPRVNSQEVPFCPTSAENTQLDNILISDRCSKTIHILNNGGNIMSLCSLVDFGIEYPYSLSFNKNCHLFVGCSMPKDNSDNAKLFELEFPGY